MNKETKFVYIMVAVSLLLVGGIALLVNSQADKARERGVRLSGAVEPRRLSRDIGIIDSSGERRTMLSLKGKVTLVSYVFTRCPSFCAGICTELDKLRAEFGDDGPLHLVSVTLDPEHDTPEQMAAFAERQGLVHDNWWFATSAEPIGMRAYMEKEFSLSATEKPADQRTSEYDLFDHQPKVVLMDHRLRMVGWYEPFEPASLDQLKRDLKAALAAAEDAS